MQTTGQAKRLAVGLPKEGARQTPWGAGFLMRRIDDITTRAQSKGLHSMWGNFVLIFYFFPCQNTLTVLSTLPSKLTRYLFDIAGAWHANALSLETGK